MSRPVWPWLRRGKQPPLRRTPQTYLTLETLEDRLALSTTLLSHDQWRQQRFSVDYALPTIQFPRLTIDPQSTQAVLGQSSGFGDLIHLDQAFAKYAYRGDGYSVAVIDTGIDYKNPALGGGWGKRVVAGYDYVNRDADPMDDNGHGTHVAGIIGSSNSTYSGVAPNVNLIALKVLGADGSGSFGDVESALQWVISHRTQYNIVAVNMSLGAGNYGVNPYTFLEDEFTSLKSGGVFIAVASGNGYYSSNSKQGLAYPSISSQVVSVGAVWAGNFGQIKWGSGAVDYTTAADRVASFSQRGAGLDILAPGGLITSTHLGNKFVSMAGTSMASPVVAGAAAILHQALDSAGRPAQANQDYILGLMQSSGFKVNDGDDENDNVVNSGLNFKRLDLLAALNSIGAVNTAPVLSRISDQTLAAGQKLTLVLSASDVNGDRITFSARVVGSGDPLANLAYQLKSQRGLAYPGSYFTNNNGANEKWLIGSNNEWYCILPNGELRRWAGSMSATLAPSALIATLSAAYHSDPSLLWNAKPAAAPPVTLTLTGAQLTIQTPASYRGSFTVEVSASDGKVSAKQSFTVTVVNLPPILKAINNLTLIPGQTQTFALSASDQNGDKVSYSARVVSSSPNNSAAAVRVFGSQLTVVSPGRYKGSFVVEVTASDGNLSAKQSFTVTVANVAPTLAAIANQTAAAGKSLVLDLKGDDANGDALSYSVKIIGGTTSSTAYALKQQFGLTSPGSYYTNMMGAKEKWLLGKGNQWYWLMPNGELRRWTGAVKTTLQTGALIASLDSSYYNDPSLLWNASPSAVPPSVNLTVKGSKLTIQASAGYRGTFDVEVTSSDGILTAKRTFRVNVPN